MHINFLQLVLSFGYIGLFLFIFAESGLFFGFFLPGDSLLFSVGLLSSQGHFNIWMLVPLVCIAAVLGDSVGYWFGAKVGPALFTREDSMLFKKHYVNETQAYFEKYGAQTLILARFIPAVRTFAPILAGVGKMKYSTFLRYNLLGGIGWAACVTLLGYFLGSTVPGIDKYIYPIIALIIIVSAIPVAFQWWKSR